MRAPTSPTSTLTIGSATLRVAVADTDEDRLQGLSDRESLADNAALLLVFDRDDHYAIWMKDMRFAIDILWIDAGKRVVHVESNVSPESFPEEFRPRVEARYVLETNAGFVAQRGIAVGDIAVF